MNPNPNRGIERTHVDHSRGGGSCNLVQVAVFVIVITINVR